MRKKKLIIKEDPKTVFDKLNDIESELEYTDSEIANLNDRIKKSSKFNKKKMWDKVNSIEEAIKSLDYLFNIAVDSAIKTFVLFIYLDIK